MTKKIKKIQNKKIRGSYFRVNHTLEHNPNLLQKLVRNPKATLRKMAASDSDLKCPDEGHKAFAKAKTITNRMESQGDLSPTKAILFATKEVRKTFGSNYRVQKTPFGILYREKIKSIGQLGITATGSVECSFGLDCSGDVDG